MGRILKLAAIVVIVLGGLGAGSWGAWRVMGSARETTAFRTATVEKADLQATIRATGTIEPEEVIDVGAQVAAQIKNFGVDPSNSAKSIDYGSPVHVNTLLAQLDDSLFKARVQQMQSAVDEADAQITQAQATVQKAEADLEQMKSKYKQASSDWDRAQAMRPVGAIAQSDYDAAM